jgi:hypothetical protein
LLDDIVQERVGDFALQQSDALPVAAGGGAIEARELLYASPDGIEAVHRMIETESPPRATAPTSTTTSSIKSLGRCALRAPPPASQRPMGIGFEDPVPFSRRSSRERPTGWPSSTPSPRRASNPPAPCSCARQGAGASKDAPPRFVVVHALPVRAERRLEALGLLSCRIPRSAPRRITQRRSLVFVRVVARGQVRASPLVVPVAASHRHPFPRPLARGKHRPTKNRGHEVRPLRRVGDVGFCRFVATPLDRPARC